MLNDLISRQAAIDALKNRWRKTRNYEGIGDDIAEECELYLKQLPSAQPEQRWIPCSERLPEVYKDVLICWDFKGNREVLIGNMYSDGTFHGYDDEYLTHNGRKYRKAVAWMPLPEPWRGAE